jgi:putative sigma-54 modulation protein
MQINVQSRPFKLTPALKASVSSHLSGVESRFGSRIGNVLVRMDDINGSRGGVDKRCRIVIDARPRQTVVAEALSADMYESISIAARRVEAALQRALSRGRKSKPLISNQQPKTTQDTSE